MSSSIKKITKALIFSFSLFYSTSAFCWLSDFIGVKGTIKSFDQTQVILEDSLKNKLIIPRDAVPKTYKLVSGQYAAVPVDIQKFSQIKTVLNPAQKALQMKSAQAVANIQKVSKE